MRDRRRQWWIGGAVVLLLLAADLVRAPEHQWTGAALVGAIGVYQRNLSPLLASTGARCRFQPSCSHYGAQSIRVRGAFVGTWFTAWRILRCGPWTEAGTEDFP